MIRNLVKPSTARALFSTSHRLWSPSSLSSGYTSHQLTSRLNGSQFARLLSTQSKEGKYISYEIKDDIAVVKFNDKSSKVNALSEGLMKEAEAILSEVRGSGLEASVKGIVFISGKADCFIAGADINMLELCASVSEAETLARKGHRFLDEIENSPIPIVAAIKGSCLGGGLEVALASHYRIAVNDKSTVLALPEVMLGLLPGGGGTQRLPKLIAVPDALQMILMAKNIRPSKAKKMGLVDMVLEPLGPGVKSAEEVTLELLEEVAIQTAKDLASKKLKIDRKRPITEKLFREAMKIKFLREKVLDKARTEVNKFAKGHYPAPLKIIEVIGSGLYKSRAEGYADEARGFAELTQTSESKAFIGLFHGHTHCKKNHFGAPKKSAGTVAVLGAGLMGAGIAQVTVDRGLQTILKDTNSKGLVRGQEQIVTALDKKLAKGSLQRLAHDRYVSSLLPTLDYSKFKDVDVVIEAVFEDIKVKHKVLAEVESVTRDDCVFASNTSALPITEIAAGSKRPENVIGMHYFSPVDKMPLLEIVTTDKTSKETISRAVDLGLKQKKIVIVVKDCPGFYTTRCLSPGMSEILLMLQEGLSPLELNDMASKFGFPIGIATLMDEVGIDVAAHVATYMRSIHPQRYTGGNLQIMHDMVAAGFHGRKSGKGWFLYDKKDKKKGGERPMNPAALEIIKRHSVAPKLKHTPEDLQFRLASRFINEAVLCLEEGILANPLEGDIGAIFGIGFPPFLGGPFRFLDTVGADTAVDVMHRFVDIYGDHFKPCQLLLDHAKDPSKKFHVKK